ncbi:hypothetical protein N9D02_08265 [Emcibacteraceae bacterium]|nr:hypothetical protein [Emcibacteraceae bacterium]
MKLKISIPSQLVFGRIARTVMKAVIGTALLIQEVLMNLIIMLIGANMTVTLSLIRS